MKTILVLTDFSINADYTAHYALHLAQQIKANILLCNIYQLAADERTAASDAWPLSAAEQNSIEDLGELAARLKTAANKENAAVFRPEISQCSLEGSVADRINEIAAKNHVLLAVISNHNAGLLSTLLSGDHAREIIDNAILPVLIIPYQVRFHGYRNIAFARNRDTTHAGILQTLSGLAKDTGARLWVAQISGKASAESEEAELAQFCNGIRYRLIRSRDIAAGLKLLSSEREVDLLVLVHQKKSFLQRLVKGSITRKMMHHPFTPLLIFPESKTAEVV